MNGAWKALVLAGARGPADPVAQIAGVSHKAFAPLAGKPMIAHVLDALAEAPEIGETAVVIEPEAPELPRRDVRRIDARSSPSLSALAAFEALGPPVFLTTADNPLLTAEMIHGFLAAAAASGADVAAAVATREVVEASGRGGRRTYLHFRDGQVSGCNLFALMTPKAAKGLNFWCRLESERKRPWRMALELGLGTLLRYALGMLSSDAAVMRFERAAGLRAALVRLPFPEAAHDVDKPEDLVFAAERLALREREVGT